MKKNEIPDYVFTKKYDYYFLTTEFDIVFSNDFYTKFNLFLSEINSEKLVICLHNICSSNIDELQNEYIYELPNSNALKAYHELEIGNVPIYVINHFISDNNYEWEIYVSFQFELSIIAVNKNLVELFTKIFKPYEEEGLNTKIRIISGQFIENYKSIFIAELMKNYNFMDVSYDL